MSVQGFEFRVLSYFEIGSSMFEVVRNFFGSG